MANDTAKLFIWLPYVLILWEYEQRQGRKA